MPYVRMKKQCQVYKGNPECEGEFWVDVRSATRKIYCNSCMQKKYNNYQKEYQRKLRYEQFKKKKQEYAEQGIQIEHGDYDLPTL